MSLFSFPRMSLSKINTGKTGSSSSKAWYRPTLSSNLRSLRNQKKLIFEFALYGLFVALLLLIIYQWQQTQKSIYLSLFLFIFALSLSHHHMIIFLTPSFVYLIWQNKRLIKIKLINLLSYLFIFLSGLLPYLYIYLRAIQLPPISWNNPVNLKNFIFLISRSQYGS